MKLVIAEKPSVANAIRDVVGGEFEVTNVFGHILEMDDPDSYLPNTPVNPKSGKKIWRAEDLPILPKIWKNHPKKAAQTQLKKIGDLLKKATLVVNAGDPDREGQLLIDEILDHFRFRGRVDRVWLSAIDPASVRKAFSGLRPNGEFRPLCDAAQARGRADWLVGMNFTRAVTANSGTFYSVGRVQTPTLALVVRRDLQIESFRPKNYFEVSVRIAHANGSFSALWKPASTDGPGFDEEGRIKDRSLAALVANKGNGPGKISRYEKKEKREEPPLPYSLSALQKAASGRYGFSAAEVLEICQSLYEKKVQSYPRSDCRYLPLEQFDAAPGILSSLPIPSAVRKDIDPKRRHSAWNTGKVTAHHAIVPTGEKASLTEKERKIHDMVQMSYAALFLPDRRYFSIGLSAEIGGEAWVATGRKEIEQGWKALFGNVDESDEGEEGASLPEARVGDPVAGANGEVLSKETKPPSRFTDGTLIEAMSNIHRFVEDPEAKKTLKETSGIGTEATRAGIIEILVGRDYVSRKGKQIVSTPRGRSLVGFLEMTLPDLTNPVTTARWEDRLGDVASGSLREPEFVGAISDLVRSGVSTLLASSRGGVLQGASPALSCPVCGDGGKVVRRESQNKKGVFYWTCSSKNPAGEPVHPPLSDEGGKPGSPFGSLPAGPAEGPPCPSCGQNTLSLSTSKNTPFFQCPSGHGKWWSDSGAIGNPWSFDKKSGTGPSRPGSSRKSVGRRG
jgi:DNA topoisomerase-3